MRFDDRVTGKFDEFCPHARKIHIDIDPGSISKVVKVDVPMVCDCGQSLEHLAYVAGCLMIARPTFACCKTSSLPRQHLEFGPGQTEQYEVKP